MSIQQPNEAEIIKAAAASCKEAGAGSSCFQVGVDDKNAHQPQFQCRSWGTSSHTERGRATCVRHPRSCGLRSLDPKATVYLKCTFVMA